MAITASEVIDQTLELLDEDPLNPVFWTREELLVHLNDAIREFNLIALKFQERVTSSLPQSVAFQVTPLGAIAVLEISRGDVFLRKRVLEGMDREQPRWQLQTGARPKQWGPVGINLFFLSPNPTTNQSLELTLLQQPMILSEDTVIDLDDEYVDALGDYVFHMARFKEGGAEFQQSLKQYESFRSVSDSALRRRVAENHILLVEEPGADTGPGYTTSLKN